MLENGDWEALGASLEAREAAFEALRIQGVERPLDEEALGQLARVESIDARILCLAHEVQAAIRIETEEMRRARRAARALRDGSSEPRFVTRRV